MNPASEKKVRRAKLVLDFVMFHLTFDVCADKCLLYAIDFGLDVVDANADWAVNKAPTTVKQNLSIPHFLIVTACSCFFV